MLTQKSQKSQPIFSCLKCAYNTSKKNDYEKHLLTLKHQNVDILLTNVDTISQKVAKSRKKKFTCDCGKEYKHRQSLYVHKKTCKKTFLTKEETNDKLVEYLIKENQEFKNLVLEAVKNGTNYNCNNTTTNTNSHNKSFNLQFFLNETCKNAMNITDFLNSLHLQITDLEKVGELGYIEGISSIIIKNLNALDVSERPIHCTDKKRETMYIKDEDKWEKEDEQKVKMHKMVKKVANKNIHLITAFQEMHPEYKKITSKYADQYNKIIIESMGGKGENDYEKEEKIIKKIAKEVWIDK
jgi:hypothetical protein